MSEHRRKIPQPDHGGRAAARRNYGTASHGAGRRPAPTPRISPEATPATLVAARAAEKSHSRFKPYAGRTAMAGVLLAASGAVVLHEEPKAQSVPVAADSVPHAVYRTGGDGLYLHDGPGLETPLLGTMPDGMQFTVDCFTLDDPVNGNPVWLEGTAADGRHGSASDYYIDTHWNTTQDLVNQGIEQCGTQAPAASAPEQQPTQPQQTSCYFNMKWLKDDLTFSYEGDHRYYGNAWQAAKNWTDLDAGISIRPAPEGQEGDIVFKDVYDSTRGTWYGLTKSSNYDIDHTPGASQQNNPGDPGEVTIFLNQFGIEHAPIEKHRLNDKGRTYAITHELGHALGLAHPDGDGVETGCGYDMYTTGSIMKAGDSKDFLNDKRYTTPQEYDKNALNRLYG